MSQYYYKVGMIVMHNEHSEWGPGEIKAITSTRVYIIFEDDPKSRMRVFNRKGSGEINQLDDELIKIDGADKSNSYESFSDFNETSMDEIESDVYYFSYPYKILSYRQLYKPKNYPLKLSGVYGWYFDELPPYVPKDDCTYIKTGLWPFRTKWWLLYIGKASNLSQRLLLEHYEGDLVRGKAMSSLRQTLGCLLCKELGLYLWKYKDFPKREYTFGNEGEEKLSKWMTKHARVAYVLTEDIVELEEEAIDYYTLPLNSQGNTHFFINPSNYLKLLLKKAAPYVDRKKPKKATKKAYKQFVKECKRLGIKK